jgi:hypothetical protein
VVERSETPSNNSPSKNPEGAQQPIYNAYLSFGTLTQGISLGTFGVIAVAINIFTCHVIMSGGCKSAGAKTIILRILIWLALTSGFTVAVQWKKIYFHH